MNDNSNDNKKPKKIDSIEIIDNYDINKNVKNTIKKKNYIIFYLIILFIVSILCILLYVQKSYDLDLYNLPKKNSLCSTVENERKDNSDSYINYSNSTQSLQPDKIFEKNRDSIVRIVVSSSFRDMCAIGSGIVLNKEGYILTNAHVVESNSLNPKISVLFENSKDENDAIDAKLVGLDITTDLAVIKVKRDGLVPVSFGNSNNIKPGQSVYTMGYPLGISNKPSITGGIISGTDICITKDVWGTKYIQTDAPINSGNSGGALLNTSGEVIGINTIKIAETSVEGMGFAIPSTEASEIAKQIISKGYVARPALGVTVSETRYGIVIVDFHQNSSLKSFAHKGDRIISINKKRISSISDLQEEIKKHNIGDVVSVKIEVDGSNQIIEHNVVLFDSHL